MPVLLIAPGFRRLRVHPCLSMWYSISVPEAAVLRVTVLSSDSVRYQPVVNVLSH